jgi:hypothetical protein
MGRNRSAARSIWPSVREFSTNIWTQIGGLIVSACLVSASGYLIFKEPEARLDLATKIADYHRFHPELNRATQMMASFNRFDDSFTPKYAFLTGLVERLSQTKQTGALDSSYVDESSQALEKTISELEDQKGTLAGFNVSGDQKELQRTLINELDLREQICRELVIAINHWKTSTLDDRNSHFDVIIDLAQRSKAADAELKTRDSQEIDNARALSTENEEQLEQLQGRVHLVWIWGVLSRIGVLFGSCLLVASALSLLWPHLTRRKKQIKTKNPTPAPDTQTRKSKR